MAKPPLLVPYSQGVDSLSQLTASSRDSGGIPNPIPTILFLAICAAGLAIFGWNPASLATILGWVGTFIVASVVASSVRIAAQWEKALVFRLGKLHALRGPGVFFLLPFFDSARSVDTRIQTIDIPRRQAITKDNVPVALDGVIFMRVVDPGEAVTKVRNYQHAIQQYAQTALRDIVGGMTLDQILADRELVGKRIEEMVETEVDGWGLEVAGIRIQDIELPEDLKRVMARQASAEREKRATITKAEGDRDASLNLAEAAKNMASSPGALQLRTLQTLDGLGASSANTIVMALPLEVSDALKAFPELAQALAPKKEEPKQDA